MRCYYDVNVYGLKQVFHNCACKLKKKKKSKLKGNKSLTDSVPQTADSGSEIKHRSSMSR